MARGIIDRALRLGEGRKLKEHTQAVESINRYEPEFELLDDAEIRARADELRRRAREDSEPLDALLPEAFALCREAGKRALGQRHYDVQLIGGMVLHDGAIAEMKTGEGKTLTATLAVFLNTLAGDPVHLVTVNDYLARRDAEWMKPIYELLGVSVGVIQSEMQPRASAAQMYACDVTYGTNSEFGFDYLRDNMASSLEECVQREHAFAIVDEVDNILIDEARTPLIISGRPEQAADTYYTFARLAKQMVGEEMKPKLKSLGESRDTSEASHDYEYDEKHKTVAPTEAGVAKAEKLPRRRQPLRLRARHARQPPDPVAEGRVAVQARHRLRGDRRRGEDHRRVHRPDPRGPALVRRPAPGGRGEGGRADPRGEPDPGDDHAAELLPPLRQARRDDRHGADRGDRVHEDLRDPGGRGPDPPADDPRRPQRPDLQDQGRQVAGGRERDQGPARDRTADPRRHDLGRDLRDALGGAEAVGDRAQRPQREARERTARGRDGRPGRPPGRGHDRHQHGRPRGRHQARRRSRAARGSRAAQARPHPRRRELGRGAGGSRRALPRALRGRRREGDRARRALHLRHRAPRVAPDRQPASRTLRAPGRPRRVALLPLRRGRPDPALRRRADLQDPRPPRAGRRGGPGVPARGEDAHPDDRERAEEGRAAELPDPQAGARVRRRDERAAPGRLQVPARDPRGPRHVRRRPLRARGGGRAAGRDLHPRRDLRGLGPRRSRGACGRALAARRIAGGARPADLEPRADHRDPERGRARRLRSSRGGVRRRADALPRAPDPASDHRQPLARASL